jgi:hypothetical protein
LTAGGRVAVLAPNTHQMFEAHYGVPAAGGVLVSLNIRLSAGELGCGRTSSSTLCPAGEGAPGGRSDRGRRRVSQLGPEP